MSNWAKDGCTAMMPTCVGARIRYQLGQLLQRRVQGHLQAAHRRRAQQQPGRRPRHRTAPVCAAKAAIVNQNTLIYVLINLRTSQRIRQNADFGLTLATVISAIRNPQSVVTPSPALSSARRTAA